MLQTITNPYTIKNLNKNLAFCVTYKNKYVDLSYYCRDNINDYVSMIELPEENIEYLNSGLKATNMEGMFYGCNALLSIPNVNIDSSIVTNMSYLFYNTNNISNIVEFLNSLDTSSVTNMSHMFEYANTDFSNIGSLELGDNVTDISYMFSNSKSTQLDINFDFYNIINSSYMFAYISNPSSISINNFDLNNDINVEKMFFNSSVFNISINNFSLSENTNVSKLFEGCTIGQNVDINFNIKRTNNASISHMFENGSLTLNSFTGTLDKIKDVSYLFSSTELYLGSNTDLSLLQPTNTSYMFYNCNLISSYYSDLVLDMTNSTDMTKMFEGAFFYGTLNLNFKNLRITNSTKYEDMFNNFISGGNIEINIKYIEPNSTFMYDSNIFRNPNNTIVLDIENQTYIGNIFNKYEFLGFGTIKISNTKNSSLTSMKNLFSNFNDNGYCNTFDLSEFNTDKITDMSSMFENSFIGWDVYLESFNTEKLVNTSKMFYGSQMLSLSMFSTSNVKDMSHMFENSSINIINGVIDMKSCTNYTNMFTNCFYTGIIQIINPPANFDPNIAGLMEGQYEIV